VKTLELPLPLTYTIGPSNGEVSNQVLRDTRNDVVRYLQWGRQEIRARHERRPDLQRLTKGEQAIKWSVLLLLYLLSLFTMGWVYLCGLIPLPFL
jgi:hypothetical protein